MIWSLVDFLSGGRDELHEQYTLEDKEGGQGGDKDKIRYDTIQ